MELCEIEDKIARNEMSAAQVFTQMKQHINNKKGKGIPYKGLTITTKVNSYTPARPAPIAQTPDSPGYDDPGDDCEVEYEVTGAEVDCYRTLADALDLESDEDLGALVIADHKER